MIWTWALIVVTPEGRKYLSSLNLLSKALNSHNRWRAKDQEPETRSQHGKPKR
jgi:hypothetical protein